MLWPTLLARTGHSAIALDQKQVALWRFAWEAVTVGIAEEGDVAVVMLQAAQCPSRHGPCLRGVEQAAKGLEYCGVAVAPMRSVAQGGGHRNGVNIGQVQSSISYWRPH
jgi:hypothetical protein